MRETGDGGRYWEIQSAGPGPGNIQWPFVPAVLWIWGCGPEGSAPTTRTEGWHLGEHRWSHERGVTWKDRKLSLEL